MALEKYNDLLDINNLSTIFSVSKNTIYKSIKKGEFGTPIKIGRAYKIPKMYIIQKYFSEYG
jgi:predicted DNA-binding transcriptional regulator AlpA